MTQELKRIDIKEFREKGYLQELNRQFLHPLGLALEIIVDPEGKEPDKLGGVWDYRQDPDGMAYTEEVLDCDEARGKASNVEKERHQKALIRQKSLGYVIQPVPGLE
jgi:hypothetical protein